MFIFFRAPCGHASRNRILLGPSFFFFFFFFFWRTREILELSIEVSQSIKIDIDQVILPIDNDFFDIDL